MPHNIHESIKPYSTDPSSDHEDSMRTLAVKGRDARSRAVAKRASGIRSQESYSLSISLCWSFLVGLRL